MTTKQFGNVNINKGFFFLAGLVLGDNCYINGQCTGTQNSGVCMADQTNNNRLMCRCKTGFIRYADSCLQGTKNIFRFLRTFIFLYFDILNNNLDLLKSMSAIIKDKSKK